MLVDEIWSIDHLVFRILIGNSAGKDGCMLGTKRM